MRTQLRDGSRGKRNLETFASPVSAFGVFRGARRGTRQAMAVDLELALYELFVNKEELLPLWLRLRGTVESLGPHVRVERRDRYARFDRKGAEFTIAEPTSHHRMEVGLHTPGLPHDDRFRDATGFGSRRITHRVSLPENGAVDEELLARLRAAYALAWEGEPR